MVYQKKNWLNLRRDERENIGRSLRNRGLFRGMTDLLEKPRADGTKLSVLSVWYIHDTNSVMVTYRFNWGGEEEIQKRTYCKMCWEMFIHDSFEIPVDDFKQMLVK
ncbi:hypothetical protein D7I46_09435 [Lactococcus allomyrinae]|uniref:Uncharacterized protein n=2 Tax=Lactococcus allomyrinae TaxID=2419773 RepID=A0A387BIX6_9LACT|nr:hypothetical protein D7I46_09435 [Lactococcus allomyrinae]